MLLEYHRLCWHGRWQEWIIEEWKPNNILQIFEIQSSSFSLTSCLTKAKEPSLTNYLLKPGPGWRREGFMPFPRTSVQRETQTALLRIWTQIDKSISYNDNHLLFILELIKWMEKKLDGNYIRMLHVVWNKSWKQHSTKQQLYSHLPPILQTNQVKWTRHMGPCWRSKAKLISNILQ